MTQQRKWYSLADKVWNPANLALAAAAVLANQGAAGVDHQSCDQFAENLGDELDRLGHAMRERRYKPLPVRRIWIPKQGSVRTPPTLPLPTAWLSGDTETGSNWVPYATFQSGRAVD